MTPSASWPLVLLIVYGVLIGAHRLKAEIQRKLFVFHNEISIFREKTVTEL